MPHLPGQNRGAENLISFIIIGVLVFVATALFVKQSRYEKGRLNYESQLSGLGIRSESSTGSNEFAGIVPGGFKLMSKTEVYTPQNLYEKINGKAEFYLDVGFESLNCQRFVSITDAEAWCELYIYDMAAAYNAFAVYSTQRRADARPIEGMASGYKTDDAVFAAAGKYYIEIFAASDSADLTEAMRVLIENFVRQKGITAVEIKELSLFPKENLTADGFALNTGGTFGYIGLTNTFTAQYEINGKMFTAFISRQADERTAKNLAEQYSKFLVDNGAVEKKNSGFDKGKVLDFYDSIEIVFSSGVYTAGVHEAENLEAAVKIATILNNKLAEVAKK